MDRRTVLAVSSAGAESAADMSLGAPYIRVPYVSPIYNWAGFHFTMKVCLICGLLLVAIGQAWSAGAPSAPQIKQASVNGVTLVYQEQGDGAPVVFIHGCCTDYRAWDAQRRAVAPHYRFIGLNMRYFGTAPWPDGESKYSQQTDADDIAAFIRGLNAGPVDLVGWSYSGPIVMLVVLQHPELVHSLTIHEPGSLTYVTDPAIAKIASEDRLAAFGAPLVAQSIADLVEGTARIIPQDRAKVTKAAKLRKEDGLIDWTLSAQAIHNLVRAMQPWPLASTTWTSRDSTSKGPLRLIIHSTQPVEPHGHAAAGTVLEAQADRLVVAAGAGALRLILLQVPGKKPMPAAEFLRGHRVGPGDVMSA